MKEPGTRYPALMEKLKQHGHRITPQRAAILRILVESQAHPSVEQVYEQVKISFPMTSLATVYKTVTLLKEEGEILELGFANDSSRYDGYTPYPHPHLICVGCGRIIDPAIEHFNDVPQELAHKYGYRIVNQRVDFFGICPRCQAENENMQEV
jgi:Fur family transcriptional regulator, peroxide stress response regulator